MVFASKPAATPCGNPGCAHEGPSATRPLASNEELWFRAQPTGTGVCVSVFQLEGAWSLSQVQAAATATAYRHPILLASILSADRSKPSFHICRPPNPIRADVAPWPAASDGQPLSLLQLAERELNRPMEEMGCAGDGQQQGAAVAVFQVRLYSSELSCAAVLRTHAAALDRHAAATVAASFLSSLAQEAGQEGTSPAGGAGTPSEGLSLPPPLKDLLPPNAQSKGIVARTFDMMSYVTSSISALMLPFQKDKADCRKNAFRTKLEILELNAEETQSLLSACSARRCSLFGALGAALLTATAARMPLGKKGGSFAITSIVNCRSFTDPPLPADAVGVFDSGLPLNQTVTAESTFWGLAASLSELAKSAVERQAHFTELPVLEYLFSKVHSAPSITPQHSFRTNFLTAFADAPLTVPWASGPSAFPPSPSEQPPSALLGNTAGGPQVPLQAAVGPIVSSHGVGPCVAMPECLFQNGVFRCILEFPFPLYREDTMADIAIKMKQTLSEAK